jgi:hypothetical protein
VQAEVLNAIHRELEGIDLPEGQAARLAGLLVEGVADAASVELPGPRGVVAASAAVLRRRRGRPRHRSTPESRNRAP